jgi:pimeloyl-ACP methyl ester carboxylesterase
MTNRIKVPVENTFRFEGVLLNYRIVGEGRPVILLHGSMVADIWGGFEKLLGKHYKVYLPELPGFGASEAVDGQLHNTELFARALSSFLKYTELERAPVIAFSLGTVVAIKAATISNICGEFILVGMPVRLESKLLQKVIQMPLAARRALATSELARGGILLSILRDVIGTADRGFALKYLSLLKTSDIRAMVDGDPTIEVEKDLPWLLSRVTNKMYFVYGEHDKLRQWGEKLLGREIIMIDDAGHDVFMSQPEKTLKVVMRILDKKQTFWEKIWDWWKRPI